MLCRCINILFFIALKYWFLSRCMLLFNFGKYIQMWPESNTAQKMKFSIKVFFSKYNQIRRKSLKVH